MSAWSLQSCSAFPSRGGKRPDVPRQRFLALDGFVGAGCGGATVTVKKNRDGLVAHYPEPLPTAVTSTALPIGTYAGDNFAERFFKLSRPPTLR